MHGSLLDVVLLVAIVVFAVSGYRQGFVVGALSFVGFFGGALIGVQLAPLVAGRFDSDLSRMIAALAVAFGVAIIGQTVAVLVGAKLRDKLRAQSIRTIDNIGGMIVSTFAVLMVAWMVATPLASSPSSWLSSEVRRSAILTTVDDVVPDAVRSLYSSFSDVVSDGDFPEVFGRLTPTEVTAVESPDPALRASPVVRNVRPSVVKVVGLAPDCDRRLEGSGFVYSAQRVMTNAHVVAGVRTLRVESNGERYEARVVLFDPDRDLAVLYVPGLKVRALPFAPAVPSGTDAIALGYPEDGPYEATPARVRDVRPIQGPNIYNSGSVRREVYTLRAQVRGGNSGGPLISSKGNVLGVIFAAAADDPDTGFALTAKEAAPVAAAGRQATGKVSTGQCD